MPKVPFDDMPDHARAWVFAAERPLTDTERVRLLAEVDGFLENWRAHGVPLQSARDVVHGQFLLVAVDEQATGASGCSIDALVRIVKQMGRELGVALMDHAPVFYREGGAILRVSREEFAARAARGAVTPSTLVFDNTVTSVGQIRGGRWETPAAGAWHGRSFFEEVRGSR